MSSLDRSPRSPPTADQLIALNEEMAALAAAGVPLPEGLRQLGEDLPGRLGRLAISLSARLERGESLADALAGEQGLFERPYQAIVAAGVRSGRLAAALQGIASTSRRLIEVRRTIGAALLYPLIVVSLAYWLLLFVASNIVPVYVEVFPELGLPVWPVVRWLAEMGRHVQWWWLLLPFALMIVAALWWWFASRAAAMNEQPLARILGWMPASARLLRVGCLATFTELLALMIEHKTPLEEAVLLAGEASGDRRLAREAGRVAEQLRLGALPSVDPRRFPPLLQWLIVATAEANLSRALRGAADSYRQQTRRTAQWLGVYLPLVFTVVIAGGATLLYAGIVLGPWFHALWRLGQP